MATRPTAVSLQPHHGGYSWTSTWYDSQGHRRTKRFGKKERVTRRHAVARYQDWLANEWGAKPQVRDPEGSAAGLTVTALCRKYLDWAEGVYLKNGRPTRHIDQVFAALNALSAKFGALPASSLEAPQVAALRDEMIWSVDRHKNKRALSLKTVNGRLQCIKQMYAWAREKGWVEKAAAYDISIVKPLKRDRSDAKNPQAIRALDWSIVEKTLTVCTSVTSAMIETQWLTGMRPGEVCMMRPCDIERDGDVWLYRPASHKVEHMDITRVVALGPQVQQLIKPLLDRESTAYLFTPAESETERRAAMTAARKTHRSSGNCVGSNCVRRPRRRPGDCYTEEAYRKAIHYACDKVFDADRAHREARDYAHRWNPNQLRHSWATRIRAQFGIEQASIGLGHSNLKTTEIYAERDLQKAIEVARKVG